MWVCRALLYCVAEFWYQTVDSPVDEGRTGDDDDFISCHWQLILACVLTCLIAVALSLAIVLIWTRRHEFGRGYFTDCSANSLLLIVS